MYRVIPDAHAIEQAEALPAHALTSYAETFAVLGVDPWSGHPQNKDNPDGAVRYKLFGPGRAGHVVYLIIDADREVHVLLVQWLGID